MNKTFRGQQMKRLPKNRSWQTGTSHHEDSAMPEDDNSMYL